MAQSEAREDGIQLGFITGAFRDAPNRIHLLGVAGQEELSHLFEYALLLSSPGGPLTDDELKQLVRQPCAIALGKRPGDVVHGVLTSVTHVDTTRHVQARYVAHMVPQVALLDMGKRSAIYQDLTVPELIDTVLSSYGLSSGTHYSILVTNDHKSPKHEYIVQYQESDWAFLQRWLEHEGFFYWFKHTRGGAMLMVADANDDATTIEDPGVIAYRERNNVSSGSVSTIWDVNVEQRRIPTRVAVVDYNYRRPTEMLVATHDVDEGGFGTRFHYGEHFKDVSLGKEIAKLRGERHLTEQRTVSGVTDCARFRVGHSFELENHHHASYDDSYLITKLTHRVGYRVGADVTPFRDDSDAELRPHTCAFEAIPLSTPFRPARKTEWPRLSGFVHGHIEADSSGDYAQIDDQGRYKVKLPFDVGTQRGLPASRWIRMAQAYAGAGYGMHFPLHKGTEVLISHNDGDPDRPIIVGCVPNPQTPSPVVAGNATQSVIDTASGIRVELEDLQR